MPSYMEIVSHLPRFLQLLEEKKVRLTSQPSLTDEIKQRDALTKQTEDMKVSKDMILTMFEVLKKNNSELQRISSTSSSSSGAQGSSDFAIFSGTSFANLNAALSEQQQASSDMAVDEESERGSSKRGRSDDA